MRLFISYFISHVYGTCGRIIAAFLDFFPFFLQKETQTTSQNVKAIICVKFLYIFCDLTACEKPDMNQNAWSPRAWQVPPCWWERAVAKMAQKSFPRILRSLLRPDLLLQLCLSAAGALCDRGGSSCLALWEGGLHEAWRLLKDLNLWISVMFVWLHHTEVNFFT